MKIKNEKKIVFDKYWFKKHQKKLLWLANSWLGKYVFQFKKMGHYLDPKKKITKITPFSVAQLNKITGKGKKRKAEFTEHFFSRNEYARKLYFVLLPMWYLMHAWDWIIADHKWFKKWQLAPRLNFGFLTLTQYPATIGVGNPVDGFVGITGQDSTLATILGLTNGSTALTSNIDCTLRASGTSNQFSENRRPIICFDTSALTSGAIISAALLSLYCYLKTVDIGDVSLHIVSSTPANTNAIVTEDYDQLGSTSFGSVASISSLSEVAYTDFTLNSSGISNISKTGISKFGMKHNWDLTGSFNGTWSAGARTRAYFYFTGAGVPYDFPKLVVTYTVAVSATDKFFLLF